MAKKMAAKKMVWEKPAPKGASKKLSPTAKVAAKKSAAKAGRPYPNSVDKMNAAKKKK